MNLTFEKYERQFVENVCRWIAATGNRFTKIHCTTHCILKVENTAFTFVLDFLKTPYQKPTVEGFHFAIDQFIFSTDALESRINSILHHTKTVFARNTSVAKLTRPEAEKFFQNNHLSGYLKARFHFGLWHKNELVAAISFAQGRSIILQEKKLRSYEWVGFCTAKNTSVAGGLSKLIKAFVRHKKPDHIATFVEADWAGINSFRSIGFKKSVAQFPPMPFAVDWQNGTRIFPNREQRERGNISREKFPYLSGGQIKFEHFYATQ